MIPPGRPVRDCWPTSRATSRSPNLVKTRLLAPTVATNDVQAGHAYYFRLALKLTNSLADCTINATAYIDDGAVFYVNGTELSTRIRMNPEPSSTRPRPTTRRPLGGDIAIPDTFSFPGSALSLAPMSFPWRCINSAPTERHCFWTEPGGHQPGSAAVALGRATPGVANKRRDQSAAIPAGLAQRTAGRQCHRPLDNNSQRDPWTELYNSAATNFSLAGYYLTDTYTNLTKWALPAVRPFSPAISPWSGATTKPTRTPAARSTPASASLRVAVNSPLSRS